MQRKVLLQNREIVYNLRRRRRSRRLSLSVNCNAEVAVTAPHFVTIGQLESFIKSRADWLVEKIEWFKSRPAPRRLKGTHQEYLLHKSTAYQLAKNKLAEFNKIYSLEFRRITIRNQSSRWGSCSGRGTLSFNYKIALLPEHLAEYVVAHELCHLQEMNHSVRFWALLAKAMPDCLVRRGELRKIKF
ncbi:M48 family metallopeptidase [Patescibacteria group bacterium]|nr:M48 family metallopeptidase [Patescibacteria group bacterium]